MVVYFLFTEKKEAKNQFLSSFDIDVFKTHTHTQQNKKNCTGKKAVVLPFLHV